MGNGWRDFRASFPLFMPESSRSVIGRLAVASTRWGGDRRRHPVCVGQATRRSGRIPSAAQLRELSGLPVLCGEHDPLWSRAVSPECFWHTHVDFDGLKSPNSNRLRAVWCTSRPPAYFRRRPRDQSQPRGIISASSAAEKCAIR